MAWDNAWERERRRWLFFVEYSTVRDREQLLELLAPSGYRCRARQPNLPRGGPQLVVLVLLGQFTMDQLFAEVNRVHAACDSLGLAGLDDVDVGTIDPDRLRLN